MKNTTTEYYFSKKSLTINTAFVLFVVVLVSYFAFTTYFEPSPYNDKKFFSISLTLILLVIIGFILPRFFTIISSIIKKQPALILTKENLIDFFSKKTVKWSDISEIKDKHYASPKGGARQITIYFVDSDKKLKIPDALIECKKDDLLDTLIKYHQKYK